MEYIETDRNQDQNSTVGEEFHAHEMWNRYGYTREITICVINIQLYNTIPSKIQTNIHRQG